MYQLELKSSMFTDINLPPRMPDEDHNFVGSLVGDVTCNPRID